ncbi:MAG: GreA/GreB family elongation factor [Rubrivivax sp.]
MEVLALERTLTELDHVRLTHLIQRHKLGRTVSSATLPIERVLDEANLVHWRQVRPDVVTMRSRVVLKDLRSGAQDELTLCYPADADASAGAVSVLSPVGWSLLGQRVGATVSWPTPAGGTLSAEIVEILFQPKSSGATRCSHVAQRRFATRCHRIRRNPIGERRSFHPSTSSAVDRARAQRQEDEPLRCHHALPERRHAAEDLRHSRTRIQTLAHAL